MDFDMNFSTIAAALKEEFNGIIFTEEEVRQCLNSSDEFAELVSRKTGLAKEDAQIKVENLMGRFESDSETAKGFMARVSNNVEGTVESLKSRFQ